MASDSRHGRRAEAILRRIEDGEEALTSTLVLVQVCSYLKWKKVSHLVPTFIALLTSLPTLQKDEVTFGDFVAAITSQRTYNLSWKMWDDIVISSQMQRLGIREIYSNDTDFDRIEGLKRIF